MTADRLNARNVLRNTVLFGFAGVLLIAANIMMALEGDYDENAVCTLFAANICLNLGIVFDLCKNIRRDFPMLVFTGTYDLLLLGRVYCTFLGDYNNLLEDLEAESYSNLFQAMQIVTLALLFTYLAYKLSAPLFRRKETAIRQKGAASVHGGPLVPIIRQISVVLLLVSSLAFFFTLLQTILNVLRNGYLTSFTQQSDANVPTVIRRLSMFFTPSFAIFLATMPSKRQMKLPLFVYGVYMLASLFTGRRNTFVCEALMIVIYFVMRDSLLPKEQRVLKKKTVFWAIVACVVMMYLLELVAVIRAGSAAKRGGFFYSLAQFVNSQGASFRVVMQTVNYWDRFNHHNSYLYLFYPFEQFVHNNLLLRTIFGFNPIAEVQNIQFVTGTHNYAHVLTYLVDPARYLSGGGFGTSFVAEAYVAYGMGGVAVISALFGVIFRFFSSLLTRPWPVITFGLIAVKSLVYVPRNFALSWIMDVFSVTYLCCILGVYLLAQLVVWIGSNVREARTADADPAPEGKP